MSPCNCTSKDLDNIIVHSKECESANCPKILHIAIVGSRRRNSVYDKNLVKDKLLELIEKNIEKEIILVSGGCPSGGDKFAEELAQQMDLSIIIHRPKKGSLPRIPLKSDYVKINYARNKLIAKDADILIAVVASDRTGGTENTIMHFKDFKKTELILL